MEKISAESLWRDSPNDIWASPAPKERTNTARHESGHACLAEILRIPLDSVSINPTKGAAGNTSLGKHVQTANLSAMRHEEREEYATRLMIVALGGLASTWVFENQKRFQDCQEDLQMYQQIQNIVPIPAANQEGVFNRLFAEATNIIRKHRDEVEAVAKALISEGTLTGTQVRRVIEKAKIEG